MLNKIDKKIDEINKKVIDIQAKIDFILQHICVENKDNKLKRKKPENK